MDDRLASWFADEDLDDLWRRVLRRAIEPAERATTEERLAAGLSRSALLQELATSPEFERTKLLDDAVAWAAAQRSAGERPRNLTAPPGVDERPVEIRWCLSRYAGEPKVLDAGYAHAEPAYLAALAGLGARELVGVDLAAAEVPGLRSVQADIRSLPFADGEFDVVLAISTLEHVGCDNTQYGLADEHDEGSLDTALLELRRVGRRILVTVPTGAEELRPEQVVHEPSVWVDRFEAAGCVIWENELYELDSDGWRSVTGLSPGLGYGDRGPGASAVLCAELRPRSLAARARLALRDRRYRDEPRRAA